MSLRLGAHRVAPPSGQARAVAWMVASIASFTVVMVIARHVTQTMHPFEMLFIRSIFMLAFMAPWLAKNGLGDLGPKRMAPFALRGVLAMTNMTFLFFALKLMPVAEVSAINFIRPIFVTILAAMFLHDVAGVRRWVAILAGFAGALVVIRPGFQSVNLGAILALCSCVTAAITFVLVKTLTKRESPDAIAFFQPFCVMPIAAVLCAFVWRAPSAIEVLWCAAIGFFAIATHRTMNRAFLASDLSRLQPLEFIRLPLAALLGWFAFGDTTDIWTWVGGATIFAASIYGSGARARPAG
jgi:drug/metabolite transporter (DMT)-like permease